MTAYRESEPMVRDKSRKAGRAVTGDDSLKLKALLAPGSPQSASSGTQSIERAVRLLREVAVKGRFGWRLSDLASFCEIDKGTVHRVLACLVRERLVQQRASDRHYILGPLLYELGLSLPGHNAFPQACKDRLTKFAERMHGVVLLLLRSGNEYVCATRVGAPILSEVLVHVGTRRLLFTSVGGVAMLQAMPESEARAVLAHNIGQEVAQRGDARLAALMQVRDRSRSHGFGVNLGDVVPGLHTFAVPVRGHQGEVLASICLMGSAEQFDAGRIAEIRTELEAVAVFVERVAAELMP